MDDLDRKILSLLAKNARMPVKEIAEQVSLTSPAVSSRIHKLETDGIISGYTVTLNRPADRVYVDALISLSVGASMILLFVVATSAQNRELAVSERTKEQIRQRLRGVIMSAVARVDDGHGADLSRRGGRAFLGVTHGDDVRIASHGAHSIGHAFTLGCRRAVRR